ncbi:hypothetical protein LTR04_005366 [Oleoguttula sp. CCFEE 6159]|nr:hypothetical protein LTR04_005366 [Oleoguttula sp. CCFEE 6159]
MESKIDARAHTVPESGDPQTLSNLKASGMSESKHVPHSQDLDQAYWYVQEASSGRDAIPASESILKSLRRRIDWRIVPIMFCCYTMQFVDKVLLNYAAIMDLNQDLNIRGNDFSNAAIAFFIAYLMAEIPNAVRVFLGIFEAAIAPSLMLISSQWYTKSEQAPRFSIWYAGLGLGQILLKWHAKVDLEDTDGQTPLCRAAKNGHEGVVKLLLERHAEVNSEDVRARTPLWFASWELQNAVVKLLEAHSARGSWLDPDQVEERRHREAAR